MSLAEKQGIIIGISGSGSTMREVYKATQSGRLPKTRIVGVFSSNPDAKGLEYARSFDELDPENDVVVIDARDKKSYGSQVTDFLIAHKGFRTYCQFGLTPYTPEEVIDYLTEENIQTVNQHGGAVNPDEWDFGGPGMSCPARFHSARIMFVRETGRNSYQWVISQRVGKNFDSGLVYRRGSVPILPGDSVKDLQGRALLIEWETQILALRDFERGNIRTQPPIPELVRVEERPLLNLVKQISVALFDKEGDQRMAPDLGEVAQKCGVSLDYVKKLVAHL